MENNLGKRDEKLTTAIREISDTKQLTQPLKKI